MMGADELLLSTLRRFCGFVSNSWHALDVSVWHEPQSFRPAAARQELDGIVTMRNELSRDAGWSVVKVELASNGYCGAIWRLHECRRGRRVAPSPPDRIE